MSETNKAVFLSYASQDAAAARRICDSLRSAGLEVWLDQEGGLAGGDAWDAKIRGQIASCALFVPLLSASTQARREGYFRLEWKLADERTHLMAEGTPFLLPVVIDDTKDREALVPKSFLGVQWTRLALSLPNGLRPAGHGGQARSEPADEALERFCARVKELLGDDEARACQPVSAEPTDWKVRATPNARRAPVIAWTLAVVATLALATSLLWLKRPASVSEQTQRQKASATLPKPAALPASDKSLVVLPLENFSPGPENAGLADSIHAEIISTLGLIADFKVTSRSAALAFKSASLPAAEFARKIGAASFITGSVQREKDTLRIQLELRRASDDALLWSLPKGDRDANNLLALQSDIAEQVARVLQARAQQGGAAAVARFMTKDPRAYDLFVKMRKLIDDGTVNWAEAAAQCEAILELDPDFMLAAMHLSLSRSRLAASAGTAPAERLRQATEAKRWAEAAARMVPGGAGDGALAVYYLQVERDGLRSLAFAENLVRAMPNAAQSHYLVAGALQNLGRPTEAVAEYQRVVELEPGSAVYERNFCWALAGLRRVEESRQAEARAVTKGLSSTRGAIASARFVATGELPASTEGLSGRNLVSWLWRGRRFAEAQAAIDAALRNEQINDVQRWSLLCARADVCARLGQPAEAAAAARDALATAERLQSVAEVGPTEKPGWLAAALVRAGRGDEAIAAAKRAVAAAPAESHVALRWTREIALAKIYAHAKRPRECVELLAKLLRVPSGITVPMLKVEPDWDNVREDAAFKALLADAKNSEPL